MILAFIYWTKLHDLLIRFISN